MGFLGKSYTIDIKFILSQNEGKSGGEGKKGWIGIFEASNLPV
jgi:hypothetical protein